jgi:ubiquitin-conjugating enzyme E2 D/E
MTTSLRLKKEMEDFILNPLQNFSAYLVDDNDLFTWEAVINGPENTPYENGIFKLRFEFTHDYPFKPPKVIFLTKIYHCNINSSGGICLDILKNMWSPALTVNKILLSISSLLNDQNPNDPLMPEIANQYINNKEEFIKSAKYYTNMYAKK